jgi:hypothetical protein
VQGDIGHPGFHGGGQKNNWKKNEGPRKRRGTRVTDPKNQYIFGSYLNKSDIFFEL